MLVYSDIFSGDEVLSDAHNITEVKDKSGNVVPGLIQCESRNIPKGGDNVDIGCGDAFGGGDNEVDDSVETVNNIIDSSVGFGYTEMHYSNKTELKSYLKSYFRKILTHLKGKNASDEEMTAFKQEAQEIVKYLVSMFDDLQYYMFSGCDPTAGHAFSYYPEGSTTPVFLYIKRGLNEYKC